VHTLHKDALGRAPKGATESDMVVPFSGYSKVKRPAGISKATLGVAGAVSLVYLSDSCHVPPLLGKITFNGDPELPSFKSNPKTLALGDASGLLKAADAILRIGHRGVTSWGALVHGNGMLTTGGGVDGSGLLATIVKSNLMPLRRYQITSMVREYILLCLPFLSCSFEHPLFFARSIPSLCTVRITVS
jgi:hypothetical protein